jgi:alanine racemase
MRSAVLSGSALASRLSTLVETVGPELVLDLRADAYGLGLAQVSSIARDVGIRWGLHSPGASDSVLAIGPPSHPVHTQWWSGEGEPVVSFVATVVSTKRVPADTPVSYGYHYRTSAETTLALVSAGFADGVPRNASGRGMVAIGDTAVSIAGRIAMDQCVVDCGNLSVGVGDEAVVWGRHPTLEDWSAWSGRSEGALLSHLGPRVVKTWQ